MQNRTAIHTRIRHTISGTAARPRLTVYRSLNNIFVQLINDEEGKTIAQANSLAQKTSLVIKAEVVGKEIAGKLKELKIKAVVFDRAGFHYHGAIKKVAETVRNEGITI